MTSPMIQMKAYSEAANSGLYAKHSGLRGKYDNVRRYWEDEATRSFIYPHLSRLIERTTKKMRRLRILDLGCGSADGYELLNGVRQRDADLKQSEVYLLTDSVLGFYKGIDLNSDLLDQACRHYGNNPKIEFQQADFTKGLPVDSDEDYYDLFFSSYGTFSHHLDDETAIQLIAEIAERVDDYCLIVCDWLGRYSYEWQNLWTDKPSDMTSMDYVVSYIYTPEERRHKRNRLQHLTLRLMSREEAEYIITEAGKRARADIRPLEFFDRSVFTGRHMDTAEYNPYAQPIRNVVNSLHEYNVRTPLDSLIINYAPKPGFPMLNHYFESVQMCWNTLVRYVQQLLDNYDSNTQKLNDEISDVPAHYPAPLRETMAQMRRVIEGVGWLKYGLPRENIIEPQLGYVLRYLTSRLQEGQGCAHGLVSVLEVDKSKSGRTK